MCLFSHNFCELRVKAWLFWVVCKATIEMLVKAVFPSGALQGSVHFQVGMVGALMQFLGIVGLRPWLLAGCQLGSALSSRDRLFLQSHQEKCL